MIPFLTSNYRKGILILVDMLTLFATYSIVVMSFTQSKVSIDFTPRQHALTLLIFLVAVVGCRMLGQIYQFVWRYATSAVYLRLIICDIIGGVFACFIIKSAGVPMTMAVGAGITLGHAFVVLCGRLVYEGLTQKAQSQPQKFNKIGVAIVGAGKVGIMLADELNYNPYSHYQPICFIDEDPQKVGNMVRNLRVLPEKSEVIEQLKGMPVQEIFIALPNLEGEKAKRLHEFYRATGCKVKLYDFPLSNEERAGDNKRVIRTINIEDLLFRESIKMLGGEIDAYYCNQVVLVTGGGGSIGSELCRQIAKRKPKQLIVLDIYENNAYDLQQELVRLYGDQLNLAVEIASVRDKARLEMIFNRYHPDVVFHAAAHKHVPLMEHSSGEVIKNNILGTYNTANVAEKAGVKKFILISTDKAVNPTNIMGASKRMCEMIIQSRTESKTAFAAVRFGNVLGSNGSVIPLFRRQIEAGGPITITDKRIIRYFMTIPEASQLVMQAGAFAKRGELFVLDMGKPVRIIDLAENMIRLAGFSPYFDIDIVEVGLRPGEKLYEELLIQTEEMQKTDNDLIFIEKDRVFTRDEVDEKIALLNRALDVAAQTQSFKHIKHALKAVVPSYSDPSVVNDAAEEWMSLHKHNTDATVPIET